MPPIPPPRKSGFTETTPVPLYWASYGPTGASRVLVIHGGPGAHHDYLLPQMLALAERRECVFYDQRGGGRSTTDDRSPVTWETHVSDLAAIADELSLTPLVLVGYSWGALLSLLFVQSAARGHVLSPRIDRMVLIDPAPVSRELRRRFESEFGRRQSSEGIQQMRDDLARSELRATDPGAYRHRMFELSVAGYFADPEAARELTPFRVVGRIQQSVWESLGDFDLLAPGELDGVDVPSLVIHGRQDPIPLESSEGVARALGARLVVLEECGHVPYVEQPSALFSSIEDFLAPA